MRRELAPRVAGRCHLGQGAERETTGAGHHHGTGPSRRGLQGQPVLGERRHRPELLPPVQRGTGTVASGDEAVPIAGVAQAVDMAGQLVEVAERDEAVQFPRHTSGQG